MPSFLPLYSFSAVVLLSVSPLIFILSLSLSLRVRSHFHLFNHLSLFPASSFPVTLISPDDSFFPFISLSVHPAPVRWAYFSISFPQVSYFHPFSISPEISSFFCCLLLFFLLLNFCYFPPIPFSLLLCTFQSILFPITRSQTVAFLIEISHSLHNIYQLPSIYIRH